MKVTEQNLCKLNDTTDLKELTDCLEEEMQAYLAEDFPDLNLRFIRYSAQRSGGKVVLSFEVTPKVVPKANKKLIAKAQALDCRIAGVPENLIGFKFSRNNRKYTVESINHRAHKYPISCVTSDGAYYKFARSTIMYEWNAAQTKRAKS